MTGAETFVDFYEILEISPAAHPETIHRVYRLLAQIYHPDNRDTGSEDRFRALAHAYRTLSDPERRAAYDAEHRAYTASRRRTFSAPAVAADFERERRKRRDILTALYEQRASNPHHPGLNVAELESRIGVLRDDMELALWYLRESALVRRSDNGQHAITVKGLETLEAMPAPKLPEHRQTMQDLPLLPAPLDAAVRKPRFVLTTLR